MLGDEHAARDAAQEIFVKVLQSISLFRAEASPVTWLYRATTNHCLNLLRDGRRRNQALETMAFVAEDEREAGLDERLTLHAVLAGVPDTLREIAVYYYLDQMSHDEIAQLIGVSRRTVGNRLVEFHAAAKLVARARRMCP
jgi:RNA polymerase sigma-70 factor (ECF subfamily)